MVKAWRELVTIPTYEIGKAEKNPIFLWNRCPETKGKSLEQLEQELV